MKAYLRWPKSSALLLGCFFVWMFAMSNDPLLSQGVPTPAASPSGEKIPDDMELRMKNNLLDQARLQNQLLQLAQQYQVSQQAIQHDQQEMESMKGEALDKAKLDRATHDVDPEKGVFTSKSVSPKPAEPAKQEVPAKPTPKK